MKLATRRSTLRSNIRLSSSFLSSQYRHMGACYVLFPPQITTSNVYFNKNCHKAIPKTPVLPVKTQPVVQSLSKVLPRQFKSYTAKLSVATDVVTSWGVTRSTSEGVFLNDPAIVKRIDKCAEVFDEIKNDGSILIRSGPFSGKTSFGKLLVDYAKGRGIDAIFVSLLDFNSDWKDLCKSADPDINDSDIFRKFWLRMTGERYESTWNRLPKPKLIIIDEVQKAYYLGTNDSFWQYIKQLQGNTEAFNSRVVLFSAYGSNPKRGGDDVATPITFVKILDLARLMFTNEEFTELIQLYNQFRGLSIGEATSTYIYHTTQGHPGFVTLALNQLSAMFKDREVSEQLYLNYLLSDDYARALERTRAVPEILDTNQLALIKEILLDPEQRVPYNADRHQPLMKLGIVALLDDSHITISAPILHSILLKRIFGSFHPITSPKDIDSFVLNTLSKFDSRTLQKSFSRGVDDKLYERMWHVEFYRAVHSIIGDRHSISVDVGHALGSAGKIDVFVDSELLWGIELLREGQRFDDHMKRFGKKGVYYPMALGQKVIINFQHQDSHKQQFSQPENDVVVYRALYDTTYTQFIVQTEGKADRVVTLVD